MALSSGSNCGIKRLLGSVGGLMGGSQLLLPLLPIALSCRIVKLQFVLSLLPVCHLCVGILFITLFLGTRLSRGLLLAGGKSSAGIIGNILPHGDIVRDILYTFGEALFVFPGRFVSSIRIYEICLRLAVFPSLLGFRFS